MLAPWEPPSGPPAAPERVNSDADPSRSSFGATYWALAVRLRLLFDHNFSFPSEVHRIGLRLGGVYPLSNLMNLSTASAFRSWKAARRDPHSKWSPARRKRSRSRSGPSKTAVPSHERSHFAHFGIFTYEVRTDRSLSSPSPYFGRQNVGERLPDHPPPQPSRWSMSSGSDMLHRDGWGVGWSGSRSPTFCSRHTAKEMRKGAIVLTSYVKIPKCTRSASVLVARTQCLLALLDLDRLRRAESQCGSLRPLTPER